MKILKTRQISPSPRYPGLQCIVLGQHGQLELGLVKGDASTEAARGQLAVSGGELGGEHHVAVRVDGANLPEAAGLDGQAVGQLAALLIEGQQADAVPIRGADEASVRAEAQLLDVAPPHVSLLHVVGEAEGAAGGHEQAGGRSFLELINACPLEKDRKEAEQHSHFNGRRSCGISSSTMVQSHC